MVPFEIPFQIKIDTAGNGSFVQQFTNDGWYSTNVSATGAGPGASWSLSKNGIFFLPGVGPTIALGSLSCAPGSSITLSVKGALPLVLITGIVWGMTDPHPMRLPSQSGGNSLVQTNVSTPRQKLYPDGTVLPVVPANTPSFSVTGPASPSFTFTLPPGTVQFRLSANSSGLAFHYALLVLGAQTGDQYFGDPNSPNTPLAVDNPTLPLTVAVENDWDTQLVVTVNLVNPDSIKFFVSALFAAENPGQAGASTAVNIVGQPLNIRPFAPNWHVAVSQLGAGGPASGNSGFISGFKTVCAAVTFALTANAGRVLRGQVWDGVSGGTLRGIVTLGSNGGAAGPTSVSATLYILGSNVGNVLTFDYDFAAAAGEEQTISASGYFELP